MFLSILPLVLTLHRNELKVGDQTSLCVGVADEFEKVARVAAEILPGQNNLAPVPFIYPEMEEFV